MESARLWPERRTRVRASGRVPWWLDGVFALPEKALGGRVSRLHALRLRAGEPSWYAQLPASTALRATRPNLELRCDADESVAWNLVDARGRVVESGQVRIAQFDTLEATLTRSSVVLLSSAIERGPGCMSARRMHYLTVADRGEGSMAHRYPVGEGDWPILLHADDSEDAVVADIGWSAVPGSRTVRPSRLTIDKRRGTARLRTTYDGRLWFPTVHRPPGNGPCQFLYGLTNSYTQSGEATLVRLDQESGETVVRTLGFARKAGPPTFVPFASATKSVPAVLFVPAYDAVRDVSEVWIVDVSGTELEAVATICLPCPFLSDAPGTWAQADPTM